MILSDDKWDKFAIRNHEDLSIIAIFKHDFGYLWCGLCFPEQKVVVLGISSNIVEFNYEKMKITSNFRTKNNVFHIEKVNEEIFLTCE